MWHENMWINIVIIVDQTLNSGSTVNTAWQLSVWSSKSAQILSKQLEIASWVHFHNS